MDLSFSTLPSQTQGLQELVLLLKTSLKAANPKISLSQREEFQLEAKVLKFKTGDKAKLQITEPTKPTMLMVEDKNAKANYQLKEEKEASQGFKDFKARGPKVPKESSRERTPPVRIRKSKARAKRAKTAEHLMVFIGAFKNKIYRNLKIGTVISSHWTSIIYA